jgi:hypothetical protein
MGTRFESALNGITGHSVRGGEGRYRTPRFGSVPARKSLRPTAYAIRAPEQERARNQENGGNPLPKWTHSRKPVLEGDIWIVRRFGKARLGVRIPRPIRPPCLSAAITLLARRDRRSRVTRMPISTAQQDHTLCHDFGDKPFDTCAVLEGARLHSSLHINLFALGHKLG